MDFLSKESRAWAVEDMQPLLLRVGSARSVGLQYVSKDGKSLDVLLDIEVSPILGENCLGYAAIRDSHDPIQWEQARAIIGALHGLARVQRRFEGILSKTGTYNLDITPLEIQHSAGSALEADRTGQVLGPLLEVTQDISSALHALVRVQEEWQSEMAEQQQELVLTAKSINKTLADLADTAAEIPRQ